MHKVMRSAAVVVAGATTFSLVAVGSANAFTANELKICWANASQDATISLASVADGPSYRHANLVSGSCASWHVKPGQYSISVDDPDSFAQQVFNSCPGPGNPVLTIRVKRQGHVARAYSIRTFLEGNVVTNVRAYRATTVSAFLRCV